MKVKLEEVDRFERDVTLRLPFRFGVITVTEGVRAYALGPTSAEALWKRSEQMVGESF